MNRFTSRRRRRGFTLMEVLLVLAILVVLGALTTVSIRTVMRNAQKSEAKLNIDGLKNGADNYFIHMGTYPPALEALIAPPDGLPNPQKWQGPYVDKQQVPLDPWGQQYQYAMQGDMIQIYSMGPDGTAGTEDDVFSD